MANEELEQVSESIDIEKRLRTLIERTPTAQHVVNRILKIENAEE